jgi:hypothetical protein
MASLKYGCLTLNVPTVEVSVAASQYFYHNGVNLVYLDSSGYATLALTATGTVYGVAIVPAGRGAGASDNYWLSSATAGADKLHVIPVSAGAKFMFPADTTVTEAMKGNACDLVAVNDGSATYVNTSASSTDIFLIQDLGLNHNGSTTDVIVTINPAKVQADT